MPFLLLKITSSSFIRGAEVFASKLAVNSFYYKGIIS
jgi:hypothetical protein